MNLKGSMVVTGLTNQAQPRRRMCDCRLQRMVRGDYFVIGDAF